MVCTARIPPKDLQTRTHCQRLRLAFLRLGFLREEQPFEPRRRTTLLVFEHALGVLGVGQRTESEQHDGQAGPTDARRQVGENLLNHVVPDAGLNGALDRVHTRRHDEHDKHEREGRVPVDGRHELVLHAREHAADTRDGAGQREDHNALLGQVDAEAGGRRLTPAHRGQVAADGPLAHQQHHDDDDREHGHGQNEHGVPVEVEERAGAQPLRLQARALLATRHPYVVERRVVEEQGRGQGHQCQPQSAQAQGEQRQDHRHDGSQRAADEAAQQEVEPEVHREHGGREAPDPGERRLAQ
jgi:hypothetical protein